MTDTPRILTLSGGPSLAMAAAALMATGFEHADRRFHIMDVSAPILPPTPRSPIVLGGGIKSPRIYPADPVKQAQRKRQRAARRKNR